jgi:succinyl-diaminopimelate desuccinylase
LNEQEKRAALSVLESVMNMETVNPPGHELPLAKWAADYLKEAGALAEVQELGAGRGNLIAKIPGGEEKSLILCAHLDTVPYGDEFRWKHPPGRFTLEGGRVYGRGASDMKGGLAAMLYAFRQFCDCQEKPKGDMILLCTADEEAGGEGARALLEKIDFSRAACVVIGEPTQNDIALASKGVLWIAFEVSGRSSHGAYPGMGVNAAELSFELVNQIKGLCEGPSHPLLSAPTCTLTEICAGIKANVVPDHCKFTLDYPYDAGRVPSCAAAKNAGNLRCVLQKPSGLAVRHRVVTSRAAVETEEENEIVQELLKSGTGSSKRRTASWARGIFPTRRFS